MTADGQGKFVIKDLDAGSYRLAVAANGYARQEYGQRGFAGVGTPAIVESGQTTKNIVVRLTPAGNVSGRITDQFGQPAVGVPIQLLRANYSFNGERTFQSAGFGKSNDRGEYRLYWVTPGRYVLNTGTTAGIAPVQVSGGSPNEVQENFVTTFYPSVEDPAQARPIDIQPGAELTSIDITVNRAPLYRVRGRVIDSATGAHPPAATIQFGYRSLSGGTSSRGAQYNAADGTFELRNVGPGAYFINATPTSGTGPFTPPAARGTPRAQMAFTVSNADVDNLLLTLAGGLSIPGRIMVDGQALSTVPGLDRMQVQLGFVGFPNPTPAMLQPPTARFDADGTFREDDVSPGDYRVTVTFLPPDFYIKEARFDQTDILGKPWHFSGSVTGPLEIVLSAKAGSIDGTIVNEKQQPASGVRAVLVPDQSRDRVDLYKTAVADQNGRFTIRGIPPGGYKVFAWEAIDQFGYFDPDLVRQSESSGKPVKIAESSKESVEVKAIPASANTQ